MKIAILSRGPQLYSTRRLLDAARKKGHDTQVIDHMDCHLMIGRGVAQVYYREKKLDVYDAIIPRIGVSVTNHGAALIAQFEAATIYSTVKAEALIQCRDKWRCLQKLSRFGMDIPRTVVAGEPDYWDYLIDAVGGFPVVIKIQESTHGVGVALAHTTESAEAILDGFYQLHSKVMLQEFIKESSGKDIRAIVVGGKVIASMMRQAQPGEFRSNLHRGAIAKSIELTDKEREIAEMAAKTMGADVAGVDILRSKRGPLVMEVNASPGLEGIETVTGVNVAEKIIELVEDRVTLQKQIS